MATPSAPQRMSTREMLNKALETRNSLSKWTLLGTSLMSFGILFVLWYFAMAALAPYAARQRLISLYTAPDEGLLPGTCLSEWDRLHQLLLVTMAVWAIGTLMTVYNLLWNAQTPEQLQAMQSSCVWQLLNAPLCPLTLYQFYVWFRGVYLTLFGYSASNARHCEALHDTAWWIFCAGFPLFQLQTYVFVCFVMAKYSAAREEAAPADEEVEPGYVSIAE